MEGWDEQAGGAGGGSSVVSGELRGVGVFPDGVSGGPGVGRGFPSVPVSE